MRRNRRPRKPTHRALALCGGGILGAAFELGWLAAWEEEFGENSIQKSFDTFIGISAGATVATVLAAGIQAEFSRLSRRLFIVATDLDLAERAVFGSGRMEDVPIPRAIAASSGIPIFCEPVKIGDRYHVDGAKGQVGREAFPSTTVFGRAGIGTRRKRSVASQ